MRKFLKSAKKKSKQNFESFFPFSFSLEIFYEIFKYLKKEDLSKLYILCKAMKEMVTNYLPRRGLKTPSGNKVAYIVIAVPKDQEIIKYLNTIQKIKFLYEEENGLMMKACYLFLQNAENSLKHAKSLNKFKNDNNFILELRLQFIKAENYIKNDNKKKICKKIKKIHSYQYENKQLSKTGTITCKFNNKKLRKNKKPIELEPISETRNLSYT